MGSSLDITLSLTTPAPRHTSCHACSGPLAWPAGSHATLTYYYSVNSAKHRLIHILFTAFLSLQDFLTIGSLQHEHHLCLQTLGI